MLRYLALALIVLGLASCSKDVTVVQSDGGKIVTDKAAPVVCLMGLASNYLQELRQDGVPLAHFDEVLDVIHNCRCDIGNFTSDSMLQISKEEILTYEAMALYYRDPAIAITTMGLYPENRFRIVDEVLWSRKAVVQDLQRAFTPRQLYERYLQAWNLLDPERQTELGDELGMATFLIPSY